MSPGPRPSLDRGGWIVMVFDIFTEGADGNDIGTSASILLLVVIMPFSWRFLAAESFAWPSVVYSGDE